MHATASEPPSAHVPAFCLCVCGLSLLMISKTEDYDALLNGVNLCQLRFASKLNQPIKVLSETVRLPCSAGWRAIKRKPD